MAVGINFAFKLRPNPRRSRHGYWFTFFSAFWSFFYFSDCQ